MSTRTQLSADALRGVYFGQLRAGKGDKHHSKGEFRTMLRACERLPAATLDVSPFKTTWIWSDLHLGHDNIIRYTGRPFPDAAAMDKAMWNSWSNTVGDDDLLLIVGDVAMRYAVTEATWQRIRASKGREKHLVIGNHDLRGKAGDVRVDGFDAMYSTLVLDGDPPLAFTHMPLVDVPKGVVNVHGHVHADPPTRTPHINVSVEQLDYRPVALERLRLLARELVGGHYPPGSTTLERLQSLGQ